MFQIFLFTFFWNQRLKMHPIPPLDKDLATSSDKRGQPNLYIFTHNVRDHPYHKKQKSHTQCQQEDTNSDGGNEKASKSSASESRRRTCYFRNDGNSPECQAMMTDDSMPQYEVMLLCRLQPIPIHTPNCGCVTRHIDCGCVTTRRHSAPH